MDSALKTRTSQKGKFQPCLLSRPSARSVSPDIGPKDTASLF